MVNKGEYNNVFLTRLVVMVTVWPDFESGRSVVVELTAIWLIRYRAVLSNGPAGPGPWAPKPQGPPNSPCVIFSSREI